MEKKGALIQFAVPVLQDLDSYAKAKGISRNAAVNLACAALTGRAEVDRLRDLVIKIAMIKVGADV